MADPIAPVTNDYIDSVIISNGPFDPNLNKTQGIPTRQLFKDLRDYLLQEISDQPSGLTDILYADLVTAISQGTLRKGSLYRITNYQTTHNIPNVSPVVLNSGPVEPLIVLAISGTAISSQAWSQEFPQDVIVYTVDNSHIPGASTGCILRRVDTILNNDVCNDFRNVKYRRWKFNPPTFDPSKAYAHYDCVLYSDGAVYFVMNPNGFAAGTASTPSASSDDWAQAASTNNFHMSYAGQASGSIVFTSNNGSQPVKNVRCPVDVNDYVDSVVFPNYGSGFIGNTIDNGPGNLFDMVIWNTNQSYIMLYCKFGAYTTSTTYRTTFVVIGGYVEAVEFRNALSFCLIILNGSYIYRLISEEYCYATTFNVTQVIRVVGQFHYAFVRGVFANVTVNRAEFIIFPNKVRQLYAPYGIGNIKFMSNAEIRGLTLLTEFGNEYLAGDVNYAATAAEQYVNFPNFWKTAIGSFANAYNVSDNLAHMLAKLKTRHISYAYEEPTEKSVIAITNGTPMAVSWQTDLTNINLNDLSGSDGYAPEPSTFRYMTYFTRHGNDFQIQQKDLIGGNWVQQYPPNYTINGVNASGNITGVTLTPTSGATESRFIII